MARVPDERMIILWYVTDSGSKRAAWVAPSPIAEVILEKDSFAVGVFMYVAYDRNSEEGKEAIRDVKRKSEIMV